MGGEILLGARFADVCARCASGDLKLAMRVQVPWRVYSNSRRSTRPSLTGKVGAMRSEGLDAGHLVDAEGWDTSGGTLGGEPIGLANVMALLGELRIWLGVEPPTHTMGFEVDIFFRV